MKHNQPNHTVFNYLDKQIAAYEKDISRKQGMKQLAELSMPIDMKDMMSSVDAVLNQAMQSINSSLQLTSQQVDQAKQRLMQDHPSLQEIYEKNADQVSGENKPSQPLSKEQDDKKSASGSASELDPNAAYESALAKVDSIYKEAKDRIASFQQTTQKEEQKEVETLPQELEQKYQEKSEAELQAYQKMVNEKHEAQQQAALQKQADLHNNANSMHQKLMAQQQSYEQKVLSQSEQTLEKETQAVDAVIDKSKTNAAKTIEDSIKPVENAGDVVQADLSDAAKLLEEAGEVKK